MYVYIYIYICIYATPTAFAPLPRAAVTPCGGEVRRDVTSGVSRETCTTLGAGPFDLVGRCGAAPEKPGWLAFLPRQRHRR